MPSLKLNHPRSSHKNPRTIEQTQSTDQSMNPIAGDPPIADGRSFSTPWTEQMLRFPSTPTMSIPFIPPMPNLPYSSPPRLVVYTPRYSDFGSGAGPLNGSDGRFRAFFGPEIGNGSKDPAFHEGEHIKGISSATGARKTDKRIRQHAASSTDSLIYNPSATLSPQPQLNTAYLSNSYKNNNNETGCSSEQHGSPCNSKVNYFSRAPVKQTVALSPEQEQECHFFRNNSSQDGVFPTYSSAAVTGSSIHNDCVNWKSMELPSDLDLSISSISSNFPRSNIVPVNSTNLDQQNAVVDSPCWKGSPSHNYQFGIGNNTNCSSVANNFIVQNHLDQHKKMAVSNRCSETLVDHEKENALSSLRRTFSTVSPITYAKPELVIGESSSSVKIKVSNAENTDSLKITQEQKKDAGDKMKKSVMESLDDTQIACQPNITAANGAGNSHLGLVDSTECNLYDPASASAGDDVMGTSFPGVNADPNNSKLFGSSGSIVTAQPLMKAIQTMTETINMSAAHGDVNTLKEDDLKLHLGFNKREALANADKKDCSRTSDYVSGIEESLSQAEFSNVEEHAKLKKSAGMTKTMNDIDCEFNSCKPDDFALRDIASKFRRCMFKSIEEVSKEICFESEDCQALLYKNLWIEAEVSLCRLKYELQFARLKLEMEKNICQKENLEEASDAAQMCSDLGKIIGQKSMDPAVLNLMAQHRTDNKTEACEVDRNVEDDARASIEARFNILKEQCPEMLEENLNFQESVHSQPTFEREGNMYQREILDGLSDTDQKILQPVISDMETAETIDECYKLHLTAEQHTKYKMIVNALNDNCTHGVDPGITRLKIPKVKMDKLNSGGTEHQVNARYCLNKDERIVHEGYNDKAHEVTDNRKHEVYDSVIAKLNILKGRVDCFESNTIEEHPKSFGNCVNSGSSNIIIHEGNSEKGHELDDSVISRLKILKERTGHLNSSNGEEHPLSARYCLECKETFVNEVNNDKVPAVDDDSFKARVEILKELTDNLNMSTMEEHSTNLNFLDDPEMIMPEYFSVQETPVSNLKPLANTNSRFSLVNHQPTNSSYYDCQKGKVDCKSSVQNVAEVHDGEMEQSNFSDCIETGSYSGHVSAKVAAPALHGSRISSVFSNILSDWEHILEDELI